MNLSRTIVCLCIAAFASVRLLAQTTPSDEKYADVISRLAEFITDERQAKELPAVSIALVDGARVVWSGGFGAADAAGQSAATEHTVYRVGSVSKLFTDLAVMQLVSQGKLDLDADVRSYLPEFAPRNPFGAPITLRQLMSHQSGLVRESPVGNYFDPTEPSIAGTVRSLNDTALVYKPGTRTKYSNAAITVAGLVVERVVGKPFEQHVREALLRPLEMESSSFVRDELIEPTLAHAWMWTHDRRRFDAPLFALGTLPAGNLYSSVDDLGNFLIALVNGGRFTGRQVIPADALAAMLQPGPSAGDDKATYGIGFRLGELDGRRSFGHGGAVYGYAAQVTGLPDEKLGVAAACALDGANGFVKRLTEYALRLLIARREGQPLPTIETTSPLPRGVADALDGSFVAGERCIELREYNDRLYVQREYALNEVRAAEDGLVVDDVTVFGPAVKVSDDRQSIVIDNTTWRRAEDAFPPPCPERWKGLIGEYGWDHNTLYIYEDRGRLWALIEWFYYYPLTEISENVFAFPEAGLYHGEQIVFTRDRRGDATQAVAASVLFKRRPLGQLEGGVFKIRPTRPVEVLRANALAASPPREERPFRAPELVELNRFDPTLKLDIRYATMRNFMGAPFYDSARAFLQRPAAEALVRAHAKLKRLGYGLLIYDAYRPWYVTKMFWEGVPAQLHDFVADPQQGSRHNRGCAVDLTLFDLKTGEPAEMVSAYDEFSPRSYPLYPGGDSRQRWRRRLLRRVMESEGFAVYEFEWWHFDYEAWKQYPILNARFEELAATPAQPSAERTSTPTSP